MRKIFAVFSGLVMLLLCFGGALPADALESLPPGMVIGDSDGMYATSEGDYYIDLVDILPGESYKKEITIRSLDLEVPFSLGILVEELESTGSLNWNDHITMVMNLEGEEIYRGPILGDGSRDWSKTPLELGVCKYGTDKMLVVTFIVDANVKNEDLREDSSLSFYWTFVGTKDQPTEPTNSSEEPAPTPSSGSGELPRTGQNVASNPTSSNKRLPQTGEQLVYQFLSGLLLVLLALFLWKKRREEEQE